MLYLPVKLRVDEVDIEGVEAVIAVEEFICVIKGNIVVLSPFSSRLEPRVPRMYID